MRNITVSVDQETHRLARIRAAELDTSVSALVRRYRRSLATGEAGRVGGTPGADRRFETPLERRRRRLNDVFEDFDARGVGLRMSDNLTREELYNRDKARRESERERLRDMWQGTE
ncbi:hypothetical protein [Candidatus Palauibacter sp.]|uniref:hypothetical protein n=1 Tax=Candidatus Palauibacter sp. TaxID=3101350 RepID=UPI003B017306